MKTIYTEASARNMLSKNGIKVGHLSISKDDMSRKGGLKTWGAADYLINHRGYFFTKGM